MKSILERMKEENTEEKVARFRINLRPKMPQYATPSSPERQENMEVIAKIHG